MKRLAKWYYGKASIRKKLVISYLILVLLPLLVFGIYSYRISYKNLIEQTAASVDSNVSSIAYSLNVSIERENDNLRYLSYNSDFREKLENGSTDVTALAQELNRTVEPVFWYFITSDRNIKGIEIFSPFIDRNVGSFLKTWDQCQDESWAQEHQTYFQPIWTYENGELYVTRTLLDAGTASEAIGIMKLEVYTERFIDAIYQSQLLDNGVLLTDAFGVEIGHREIADQALEAVISEKIGTALKAGLYETDSYILSASEPLDNGWRVYYYVDKAEIAGDINRIFQTTLLLAVVCMLVITALISVISRILSSRILKLKQCAEKVGRGEFELETETGYTDEIGVVAKSFGAMSNKINEMMEQMYQLGLEKRATELKALQAMINPHFLYNCLSSIKWKAILSEQDEIADITGTLARFYRTSLNNGKQVTLVRNELDNIRSYLELQERMHDGGFSVEYLLSEQGLDCEMPNFLLQPIVENAILHGIDCCKEGEEGKIRIVYEYGEYLRFSVYNNGPVVEEDFLDRTLKGPGKGYGIYNIQERIRMYYDETCGISAFVSEDGQTCFEIKLRKKILSS